MTALDLMWRFVLVAPLALSTAAAHGSGTEGESARSPSIHIGEDLLMAGFANDHADLYFRRNALAAIESGHHGRAMHLLRKAAFYSDKPAQALMGEILWNGSHGQRQDRAAAYAWMDLAAERGYPELLEVRENYWHALGPAEQDRALSIGQQLYARYGDDVAKPRLAQQLRRQLRNVTGSRTGFGTNTNIIAMFANGSSSRRAQDSPSLEADAMIPVSIISGSKFYAQNLWRPDQYFQHQDLSWKKGVTEHRMGMTSAGPLSPVKR